MSSSQSNANPIRFDEIALGIVCPMANEGPAAVAFVNEVLAVCVGYGFQLVRFFAILDNVSKDDTRELLNELAQRQPQLKVVWAPENRSVVDAYVRGYSEALNASCEWILEIDAGFSHQPADIHQFFDAMAKGYDCVFATRFALGGTIGETSPRRRAVSRGGTAITNLLLGTKLTDMTSGFELFSRPVLQRVLEKGIRSHGPFFQTEIKTYCRGSRWIEVPIQYRGASHHVSNASLKDAFSNLWRLFRLRLSGQL